MESGGQGLADNRRSACRLPVWDFCPYARAPERRDDQVLGALMNRWACRHAVLGAASFVLAVVLAACGGPVKAGPPNMADVEGHLNVSVGYLPDGCDPVGLDGDGRGTVMGAAFDCPEDTTLRIERFDAGVNDDALSASPSETNPGRVEWRDGSTGDVIRVVSDDIDVAALLRVAGSIGVRG